MKDTITIVFEQKPDGSYGAQTGADPQLNALLAVMLLESQTSLILRAMDAKAKSEGYGSAKEAPRAWRQKQILGDILEMAPIKK